MVLGALAAGGHFVGGMLGWWHAYEFTTGGRKPEAPAAKGGGARADVQSMVLLPLVDESRSGDGDWFVEALTSDLTAEVGRMPGALVISRDTARAYKGKAADPRDVARELGVRYVIRGSARRIGDRVRLDLEMVDGETGLQAWSQRTDLERARLDAGLGDVALQLARSVNVQTYRTSGAKVAALRPHERQADDLAMQGWAAYFRGITPENVREADGLFAQAVQRDPRSPRGLGGLVFTKSLGHATGWLPEDREQMLRQMRDATQRLRQIDENGFFTLLSRQNLARREGDWAEVLAAAQALLEQFPSHAPSMSGVSQAATQLGRFDECLAPAQLALRIAPRDPLTPAFHADVALCHFMRGEYPAAVKAADAARRGNPRLSSPNFVLAAALHRAGEAEQGRHAIAQFQASHPKFRASDVERYLTGTDPRLVDGRQRLLDSLRELGLP